MRLLLAALLALVIAAPASAADRYAAPDGAGTACTQASPCSLPTAVTQAGGETTVVLPGEYGPYTSSFGGTFGPVRGADRANPPLIRLHDTDFAPHNLTDLRIVRTGSAPGCATDYMVSTPTKTLTRVSIVSSTCGVAGFGVDLQDSAVHAATSAVFVGGGFGVLRNATLIGDRALDASKGEAITRSLTVTNSILAGTTDDVRMSGSNYTTTVSYSNVRFANTTATGGSVISDGGNNQSAAAALVAPASGDFRQLASSPTIDAGTAAGLPGEAAALSGLPRVMRAAIDIGATELPPLPAATTGAASNVTSTSATVGGAADGAGARANAFFEYGTTAAYGSRTGDQAAGPGLSAALTGLAPATTYHYRLVTVNDAGTAYGADATFTTATAPGPDITAPAFSDLALTRKRFRVGSALTPLTAAKAGTTLLYTLTEAARVEVRVQRAVEGRRKGSKCQASRRTGKRCTAWKTLGTLTRDAAAGANRLAFSGRFGTAGISKRLKPGRHRFSLRAADGSGNRSAARRIAFRVVKS